MTRTQLVAATLALASLWSARADACSCVAPELFPTMPGVPLNARFRLLGRSLTAQVSLSTADGTMLPVRTSVVFGGIEVQPAADLVAGAQYSLTVDGVPKAFTAGAATDSTAPRVLTFGAVQRFEGRTGSCDLGGQMFNIALTNSDADVAYFEVFTGKTTTSIDLTAPAIVLVEDPPGSLLLGDASLCATRFGVSKLPDLAIQVRAVDLAGNVSELSSALQLKTGGCSTSGGLAVVLASLLLARRRHKG